MPEPIEKQHLAPLPESLRTQLGQFKKHLWRIKVTEAILAGLLGLIASFVLVFALDRIWDLSPLLRTIILLLGVSLFAVFAPLWINRWVFKHRRENQLAKLISQHYPNLGDRLLGVVELQDQDENSKALSPELREAAMIAVANDAKSRDLDLALSSSWLKKLTLGVAGLALVAGSAFMIYPNAGKNALKRWFMPLSDTQRFTFTKVDLSDIPQPFYVPFNEPFSLSIPLHADTENSPKFAETRYETKGSYTEWQEFQLKSNAYDLRFKGKRSKGNITFNLGDASHTLNVIPVKRPKLAGIKGRVVYPEYLQRRTVMQDFASGQIDVLEGSQLSIIAKADRKLQSATVGPLLIEPYLDLSDIEALEIQGIDPNNLPEPTFKDLSHRISSDEILPEPINIAKNTLRLPIKWVDKYGIQGLRKSEIQISPVTDTSPSTYIRDAKKQIYILHTEVLSLGLIAEDDFGIKSAGFEWVGEFNTPSANTPAKGQQEFIEGDPYNQSVENNILMDFAAREIIPQKLTMRSYVDDYNPATERVYSEPIEIYLLSESEHANYQKERIKEIQSELEDSIRKEQELLDENKRIERDLEDPKKADEAKDKLADQKDKELDNKEEMKKLKEKMKDVLKQSMKNDSIDSKTLKEMSDTAQKLEKMEQKDMEDIAKKLDDAQSQKNSKEKTKEDLKEAIKKQEELIKEMKDTAKKAEEANKKLESSTFINRLKQAAAEEEGIHSNLLSNWLELGSKDYSELAPEIQRLAQALYLQQQQTSADIRWIQEDLRFFHARTQKEEHKKLIDKMTEANIDEGMSELENRLEKNHTYVATKNSKYWADLYREWAKELEGTKDEKKSGGGGGDQNTEDQDFEFMIKVMKMVQKEQAIRARTRALEQSRRDATKELTPQQRPEFEGSNFQSIQ